GAGGGVGGGVPAAGAFEPAAGRGAPAPPADTAPPSPPLAGGLDGTVLDPNSPGFEAELDPTNATASIRLLDRVDLFNLLCIPGETNAAALAPLQAYCRDRRAFLLVDCDETATLTLLQSGPPGTLAGADSINAAFYFPWVRAADPLQENRLRTYPPSGFTAGIYARTDATRGVFKAPAGIDASVTGASGVAQPLTDRENGTLNPLGINCIRQFPVYGTVVWGARTLAGNDERGSESKYIPVRRTTLFIEESLYRGTKWVVFEPNDEPLWAQIRLNVGAFMQGLFRQGAFAGRTPREAYFVKCDRETTTQDDVNRGIVNILVGFAPLKPAEFVIIKIQQMAGQIQT
ncbi:MAG: phage tail sheath family protein, partial [Armatimonadota bacterium]